MSTLPQLIEEDVQEPVETPSARSASAQAALIQEDKRRESVASATSLTGYGALNAAGPQNERKLGTIPRSSVRTVGRGLERADRD